MHTKLLSAFWLCCMAVDAVRILIKRHANPNHTIVTEYLVAYRIGYHSLKNANAADAAGIVRYIKDDPMGHIKSGSSKEMHAFRVEYKYDQRQSATKPFECAYKECNGGKCNMCKEHRESRKSEAGEGTSCAFGTLDLATGGRWLSFEESHLCTDSADTLPCFTYEVIATISGDEFIDGIHKIQEADWEIAGFAVQELFGQPVAEAIDPKGPYKAIDIAETNPPLKIVNPNMARNIQNWIKTRMKLKKQQSNNSNNSDSELDD